MMDEEEQARANFYGLIARLFYQAPDAQLLGEMLNAEPFGDAQSEIAVAWREMMDACRSAFPVQLEDEHTELFVGTGKSPVTLYATAYTIRYASEAPLVELRSDLARLGLSRRPDAGEPEDHIAGLCDTMRHLVAGQQNRMEDQKRFFSRWIAPAIDPLCGAIEKSERTRFYKHVGRFARAFCTVEHMSFEML